MKLREFIIEETNTHTKTKISVDDLFNRDSNPLSKPEPKPNLNTSDNSQEKIRNTASRADTIRDTSGITPTYQMRDLLSKLHDIDINIDDDTPMPEPRTPGTDLAVKHKDVVKVKDLPGVAKNALLAKGAVEPTFHQVSNLPGNMSRVIRTVGKQLFKSFTKTPTEDIYIIANVMGSGPNSQRELNAVAGYLRNHGTDLGDGNIDLEKIMPGYNPQMHQYKADGIRWLLIKDDFGDYIYSWPEQDSIV